MTWQKIYGELSDNCSRTIQHSSSRRGMVKDIDFTLLSQDLGRALVVTAIRSEIEKEFDIGEIKRKIQEWKNKENGIKNKAGMIMYWETKLKMAEKHNAEVKQKNKIQIHLNFPEINKEGITDKELLVYFADTELDIQDIKNIRKNPLLFKQFLQDLKK